MTAAADDDDDDVQQSNCLTEMMLSFSNWKYFSSIHQTKIVFAL